MTTQPATFTKGLVGLVLGAALLGSAAPSLAASNYKVLHKDTVRLGDWDQHRPAAVIRFHLPKDFNPRAKGLCCINLVEHNL